MSDRLFRLLSALCAIVGAILLIISFSINPGPPAMATDAQIIAFNSQNATLISWGAWLQTVGPLLIVLFAFSLVSLAGATSRLAGWMTMLGGMILVAIDLVEVIFYFSSLSPDPASMGPISISMIHGLQHLYFIIGAPSLFLPLGVVILTSRVLPQILGYLALALGVIFGILGIVFAPVLIVPAAVTALGGIEAIWWLAAAITLIVLAYRKAPASVVQVSEGARVAQE